jgi:hypothetical protein
MDSGNYSEGAQGPNKDVEKKLKELEQDISRTPHPHMDLPMSVSSQELITTSNSTTLKDDLYYFSGLALIGFAVLVFFQHVHVGTGLFQALGLGAGGFAILLIPLLIGIGLIVYNTKNKIGYGIVSVTCALIFYTVLSSLIMTFTPVSLLGLIIMLLPLAVGGAFVVKGMGGPKGIEDKLREQGIIKSRIG